MHRPEAVGTTNTKTAMSGSDNLQRGTTKGITDTEDSNSRDAGEMRGGGAVSSSKVNSCSTGASAFGRQNNRSVQGSATQVSLAEARWDRFYNENSTHSVMADSGEGTSSEPRRPHSHHAPGRMEAPRSSTAAFSMSIGTDPPVLAVDSERREQLLMTKLMDIPEFPQLEAEGAIVPGYCLSGW